MPVTAKLSKLFYDRLGEQVANELVDWFNQVDASYRSDLRELNELNFGRFRAEGHAQWVEHRAWIQERFAEQALWIEKRFAEQALWIEKRFAEMDAKFETRFTEMDAKFEKRFTEMDAKFEIRFKSVDERITSLEVRMERRFAEQTRFLYLALATQVALILGLYLR
jgi:hypothetical protein